MALQGSIALCRPILDSVQAHVFADAKRYFLRHQFPILHILDLPSCHSHAERSDAVDETVGIYARSASKSLAKSAMQGLISPYATKLLPTLRPDLQVPFVFGMAQIRQVALAEVLRLASSTTRRPMQMLVVLPYETGN
jgi:hypothetical protein